jgi:hypothetical protein
MRPLTCFIAAGMLAVATPSARAATGAYGEAFDTLYRLDLEAPAATRVGDAGRYAGQTIGNISGLTTMPDGSLYAVAGGLKLLIGVDAEDGRAEVLGNLGLSGQGDPTRNDALDLNMIADCDGVLWLTSAYARKLWTVDPANGATTLVGATGPAISGLAVRDGELFGATGKDDNRFYRIDPATGAATPIGAFGAGVARWINSVSMSFGADGTLWAVLNYIPPEDDSQELAEWSDLATIDPATGALEIIGPITGPETLREVGMKGFTAGPPQCGRGTLPPVSAPVNSPLALLLLVLLMAGAVGLNRRRFAR